MKKRFIIGLAVIIVSAGAIWAWQSGSFISDPPDDVSALWVEEEDEITDRMRETESANPELYQNLLEALELAKEQALSDPEDYGAWADIGVISQNFGKFKTAEQAYLRALEVSQTGIVPWNNLADIYAQQGRYDESVDTYLQGLEFFPGEVKWYLDLLDLYHLGYGLSKEDMVVVLEQGVVVTDNETLRQALNELL